jgi:hypothetical protein
VRYGAVTVLGLKTEDTVETIVVLHCAKSRKIAGSIPDGVIGIFYSLNPSGRTIALGCTQPPTEMSTMNIFCG